jgi:hypothetical protein
MIGLANLFGAGEIGEPEKDQLTQWLKAGRAILTAPKPDRELLDTLLVHPLKEIASTAPSANVGLIATESWVRCLKCSPKNETRGARSWERGRHTVIPCF